MPIMIEPYHPSFAEDWDTFVWQSNNGTIFHTRQFINYHPPGRFEDHSLIFKKDKRVIALFPATIRYEQHRRILSSHRGASYGGLVTKFNVGIKDIFEMVESLIQYALDHHFQGVEMTPPPIIYYHRPSHYVDFALVKNGFGYRKREISSVIPLTFGENEVLYTFSPESRRAVRRGVKLEVEVRECDQYETFYQILKRNLKMRHNVTPTHTLEELLLLKKIFPDRIKLFGAFAENTMVAGVVMFITNQRVVLAFYISHDEALQNFRGVNCLFFEIIKWAIRQKYSYLDFGIFTVNMEPNWGLGRFKESFGAQGIFRDTLLKYFD